MSADAMRDIARFIFLRTILFCVLHVDVEMYQGVGLGEQFGISAFPIQYCSCTGGLGLFDLKS